MTVGRAIEVLEQVGTVYRITEIREAEKTGAAALRELVERRIVGAEDEITPKDE